MRLVNALAITCVAATMLAGCSSGTDAATSPPDAGGASTANPGQALVQSKCTMCHTLDRVDAVDYDLAQWEKTIARMKTNGLVITDEEAAQIAEYLAGR